MLADTAGTGPTSPLPPPDVGFTPARATVGVLTGSTVRWVGGSAERTLMSSRRWSPRIGQHEAATGRRSPVNQNGRDISGLLPTGTVSLLAADVEASSPLFEADPDEMMSTAPPAGRIPQDPRLFRHPHSPDNDATAGVKSMAVDPCASRPVIGTQHCPSGQRNRVPVAVIPTTNTSSSAIRSSHRALSKSRRRSTRAAGEPAGVRNDLV